MKSLILNFKTYFIFHSRSVFMYFFRVDCLSNSLLINFIYLCFTEFYYFLQFLARIGGLGLIADLQSVAEEVKCLAKLQQKEDELLADVPDDFLDPIMSTLMTDPVTLPSSKQVVDRSTIAR